MLQERMVRVERMALAAERRNLRSPARERWVCGSLGFEPRSGDISNRYAAAPRLESDDRSLPNANALGYIDTAAPRRENVRYLAYIYTFMNKETPLPARKRIPT